MSMSMSHNPIRPYLPRSPHVEHPSRVCEKVVSPSTTQLLQHDQTQPQALNRRNLFLPIMRIIILNNINIIHNFPRRCHHPPNQCHHRRPLLPRQLLLLLLLLLLLQLQQYLYLFHFNPKYKFICIDHPWKYGHPVDGPVGLVIDSIG